MAKPRAPSNGTARQGPRTLRKTLRHPPSQAVDRVESWHSRIPSSEMKPTAEELRHLAQDDARHAGRFLWIANMGLRSISLLSAFLTAMLGVALTVALDRPSDRPKCLLAILPGLGITVWDLTEFALAYRRGRGMPRKVHLFADAFVCAVAVVAITLFWVGTYVGIPGRREMWSALTLTPARLHLFNAITAFLATLLVVHSALFLILILYARTRHDLDTRAPTSSVMYLPTREAAAVQPRPVPLESTRLSRRQGEPRPLPVVAQGLPPYEPVAGSSGVGTHYATPWPAPDYEPDAAEKSRAARGEAQAQCMALAGSNIRSEEAAADTKERM